MMEKLKWWVLLFGLVTLVGCSDHDTPQPQPVQVYGVLAMPAASEQTFEVYLDDNTDSGDGYVAMFQQHCQCGKEVDYYFNGVPDGVYYLYAEVRFGTAVLGTGDYLGYYGAGPDARVPPAAPNVTVVNGEVAEVSFPLGIL